MASNQKVEDKYVRKGSNQDCQTKFIQICSLIQYGPTLVCLINS